MLSTLKSHLLAKVKIVFLYPIIKANIKAKSVIINGTVHGNIEADSKLEIMPNGKLYGNIRTQKLKIADGVVFEGNCEMIKGKAEPKKKGDAESE